MDNETQVVATAPLQLNKFIYTNNNFPCLVENGDEVEDPNQAQTEAERLRKIARNALRYLTYGKSIRECGLISWLSFKTLFIKRDDLLLAALREEMKCIFNNALAYLKSGTLDEEAEKRVDIFLINLLAAYPYMEPADNESIIIPQKINNHWEGVEFHFEKIDISPQRGLLAKLIEDEDRLYAYGLVSQLRGINPYLLVMGSHYPSGQGAALNWLYNFTPGGSTGEGHDLTNIAKWLQAHPEAKVTGHSKGGTLAMILAVKFPEAVALANCLNPAPLSNKTLRRLNKDLALQPTNSKNIINVYVQKNDPVFLLGNKFPANATVYKIGAPDQFYSMIDAHINYFSGRKSIPISLFTTDEMTASYKKREFIGDIKESLDWAIFPFLYLRLLYLFSMRKLIEHPAKKAGIGLFISPIKFLFDATVTTGLCLSMAAAAATTLSCGAIYSGIKIGVQSFFLPPNPEINNDEELLTSTTAKLNSTFQIAIEPALDKKGKEEVLEKKIVANEMSSPGLFTAKTRRASGDVNEIFQANQFK